MRGFHFKKGGGVSLFLPAAFAGLVLPLVFGCGIPSAPYLPPVPSDTVKYPGLAEKDYLFYMPDPDTINPEVFEGFEIYYKLFDPLTVNDKFDANGDTSLSTPVSLTALQRAGYVRLASSAEISSALPTYPLLPIADADKAVSGLAINLAFSNISPATPRTTYGVNVVKTIYFNRTLKNTDGTRLLEGFTTTDDDFKVDDSDLPQGFDPAANFDIVIALYVFSYGNDYVNLSFNIHSTGVYLGKSSLDL